MLSDKQKMKSHGEKEKKKCMNLDLKTKNCSILFITNKPEVATHETTTYLTYFKHIFLFFLAGRGGCLGTKSVSFRSSKLVESLIRIPTGNPFQSADQSQ